MPFERILGVVLAGGASRRMGVDKRNLELGGESLVRRSASVLEPVCAEVVISTQPGTTQEGSFRTIHDRRVRSGPMAGLESALEEGALTGHSVFLLACDLPHVGTEAVRHVLDRAAERADCAAAVPFLAGRAQPLCALYRREALESVRRHLDSARRAMHELLDTVPVLEVQIGPELPFFRVDLFHNLNEPADLVSVVTDGMR